MDDAAVLADYLPVSFQSPKEQEYVAFLWDAFEANYASGKYQFAFLAYHMLTMSFVYFEIWQIRQTRPNDFAMAMVGFNKDLEAELIDATSPFTFWRVNESSVVRFLKLIGCDNVKVGNYAALVKQRNDTAHSNGNIFFSTQEALDSKIADILRIVDEIQDHSTPVVRECYRDFLTQNEASDGWEYPDSADQVREVLVHRNYLSEKDVGVCLAADMAELGVNAAAEGTAELNTALHALYGE